MPDAPTTRRRWYQFGMRTMLAATTALCIGLGWRTQQAVRSERLFDELDTRGAIVRTGQLAIFWRDGSRGEKPITFRRLVWGPEEIGTIFLADGRFTDADVARLKSSFPGVQLHRCEKRSDAELYFSESPP